MRTCFTSCLLLLLTACGQSDGSVWVFYLSSASSTQSISACAENFDVAACPSGDGEAETEWTSTQTNSGSDVMLFAEIIEMPGIDALLVIQDQIYPGTKSKDGYTFMWSNFSDNLNETSHPAGYSLLTQQVRTTTTKLELSYEGQDLAGTVDVQEEDLLSWTETDTWDPELNELFWSAMPTDTYLEGIDGEYPTNHATESDCEDTDCTLEIDSTSVSSTTLRAVATEAGPEDFDGLSDANQGLF